MGRYATRSVFVAALCAGVAMIGASVQGLLGVDAELQRSALAADKQRTFQHVKYRTFDHDSMRVRAPYEPGRDCPGHVPARDLKHLT